MDKTNPPQTFGVFKPVDHTVITYLSQAALEVGAASLADSGFAAGALTRYTPAEMLSLADAELQLASPLASFGYELDLIKANRLMALDGCHFLIVHVPDKPAAAKVAIVARERHATSAQHYGTFMIEEILAPMPGAKA